MINNPVEGAIVANSIVNSFGHPDPENDPIIEWPVGQEPDFSIKPPEPILAPPSQFDPPVGMSYLADDPGYVEEAQKFSRLD